jgi:hypothetical protein
MVKELLKKLLSRKGGKKGSNCNLPSLIEYTRDAAGNIGLVRNNLESLKEIILVQYHPVEAIRFIHKDVEVKLATAREKLAKAKILVRMPRPGCEEHTIHQEINELLRGAGNKVTAAINRFKEIADAIQTSPDTELGSDASEFVHHDLEIKIPDLLKDAAKAIKEANKLVESNS